MPRQNFLSRESFVAASEKQAKDSLLSVPAFAANIRLLAENKMIEAYKFSYELPQRNLEFYVSVTVQPLNDQYTRICLHASYPSGQAFHSDADMAIALHDFESAIQAALSGNVSQYKPYEPKAKSNRNFVHSAAAVLASAGFLFLKKKLS